MKTFFLHRKAMWVILTFFLLWQIVPGVAQNRQLESMRKQISALQEQLELQDKKLQQLKAARAIDSTQTALLHKEAAITFESINRIRTLDEMSRQRFFDLTEKASQQSQRIADTWSSFGENMGWVINLISGVIVAIAVLAGFLGFRQIKDMSGFKKQYEGEVDKMKKEFEQLNKNYQFETGKTKIKFDDIKRQAEEFDKDLREMTEGFKKRIESERISYIELTSLLYMADQYLSESKYQDAIQLYDSMLPNWGDLPIIHFQKGLAYSQSGEIDKAFKAFSRAIELNPNSFNAYLQLGIAQRNAAEKAELSDDMNNYFKQAEKTIKTAIEMQKDDGDVLCVLGGIYKRWGQAFHRQGNRAAALRYWGMAADSYQRAMQLEPAVESYARVNLGTLKILIGKKDAAKNDFRAVQTQCEIKEQESGDDLWTCFDKGLAAWALGEFESAKAAHKKGLAKITKPTDKVSVIEQLELLKEVTGDENGELADLICIMKDEDIS